MSITILQGDVRERLRDLPDESVHCVVTSPPYWGLRNYHVSGQIGLEETLPQHIAALVAVFAEVKRVLRKDGTVWLNYGDAYAGSWGAQSREHAGKHGPNVSAISARQVTASHKRVKTGSSARTPGLKPKDRMLLPARMAIALCDDGWWVRDEIIWHKPNPMPMSMKDRTTPAHEMIYMLSKAPRYYYDQDAIKEPSVTNDPRRPYGSQGAWALDGRPAEQRHGGKLRAPANRKRGEFGGKTADMPGRETFRCFTETRIKRSVWTVTTKALKEAHFATFPPDLIEPCIKAGCPEGGTVLDPFFGAGTTALVAQKHGRNCIGIELNPEYVAIAERRLGLAKPGLEAMLA